MSIYSTYLSDEEMENVCSEEQIIRNMLRFEIALARTQANLSIIPDQDAVEIESVLKKVKIRPIDLSKGTFENGIPVIPLLAEVRQHLSDEASGFLHLETTSQDVMDTAHVLMIRDAVDILEQRIVRFLEQILARIKKDGDAPCIARTRWQQATPVPFGLRLLNWALPLQRSLQRMQEMERRLLVIQFGGPTGSLSSFEDRGVEIIRALADELELNFSLPWHSQRDSIHEFTSWLNQVSGSLGKMAQDILLMSLNEVGEITENAEGGGKSSSMPHKSNPILSEAIVTLAHENSNLSALFSSDLIQTGERDASKWMSEWRNLPRMLRNTAASLRHASLIVSHMKINRERMLHNINQTNGLIYAKFAVETLSKIITKKEAKAIVDEACDQVNREQSMADILAESTKEFDINWHTIMRPETCFGASGEIIRQGVAGIEETLRQMKEISP